MGLYTICDDAKMDEHIARDCATLREIILSYIPDVVSIALVGGFGRGEGSILRSEDRIQPINDYDLIAIVPDAAQKRLTDLAALKKLLSKAVRIRQVDIALFSVNELGRLPRKMAVYDLRNHSVILFGDRGILNNIPMFGPEDILRRESRVPLFLYLGALLQAFPVIKQEACEENAFWCAQQISKAIIGLSTAHLVLRRKYVASYSERKIRALNIFSDNVSMRELIDFAYDFKLRPMYPVGVDVRQLWESAIVQYEKNAFLYFCAYYREEFVNWEKVLNRMKYDPRILALKAFARLTRNVSYLRSERLNLVKLMLCISYKSGSGTFLRIANSELMRISDWGLHKTWQEAREQFCRISPDNAMFLEGNDKVFMERNDDYAVS